MRRLYFLYFFVACIIGLSFGGCKVGPNYQAVELETPAAFRFDTSQTDTVVNLRWWELFNDPILDSLIRLALANNQDILIAARNVEQAGYALNIAENDYWPKFNYNGTLAYGNVIQQPLQKGAYLGTAGVGMNWELDLWGKLRRRTEAAAATFLGDQYFLRSLQIELIAQLATAYFQLLEFRTSLEIAQTTLDLRDSTLSIIQQRFDRGIVPLIDVNQAEIQKAIAASSIPLFERQIAQIEHTISILAGIPPGPIIEGLTLAGQQFPPEIPQGLPSDLLYRRPDLLAAEQDIIAQNAQIGVAVANRFPTISLTGFLGIASANIAGTLTKFGGNVGGNLLGPLFEWNQNKRRVDIERSRYEQTVLNYERTYLQSLREVSDALVGIQTLMDERSARQDHVAAALNAQNLSQQRYDRGVTSYLEYLESQRQAFDAQLFLAQVQSDLLISYVDLYKALGGGWLSEEEEEASNENITNN